MIVSVLRIFAIVCVAMIVGRLTAKLKLPAILAWLVTGVYILSRAAGKIGGACLGGKITKAPKTVTKYLGFTLLQHSGVSLVFTGIALATLTGIDPSLAEIVQGTIVAAAIINEIIAVIIAKYAFQWAGEIGTPTTDEQPPEREQTV